MQLNQSRRMRPRQQFAYRGSAVAPRRTSRPRSSLLHLIILSFVLLLGSQLILRLISQGHMEFIATNGAIVASADSQPIRPVPKINKQQLDKTISSLITSHSGLNVSVSYRDLTTGRTFHYGSDKSMVAASVSKLLTASYFLKQVDEGKRSLNDTVGGGNAKTLLRNLIVVSDNNAWVALDRSLGAGNLEAFAREQGLERYSHAKNTMTSDDVLTLLQRLYRGGMLSQSSTELLLDYMSQANYRQYIVAALPSQFETYHKVGFLEDRIHDVAIVNNGRFPYLLAIFTETRTGSFNFITTTSLIHDITDAINAPYIR